MGKIIHHLKHKVEEAVCKNCQRIFLRMKYPSKGRRNHVGVQKYGSVTCGRNCSKKWKLKRQRVKYMNKKRVSLPPHPQPFPKK